ncbi:MAG: hypothetical protein IKU19_05450 [Clostridia bacterium]|nr:hypothetical protein [Clostridia bacterium]
MKRRVISIVCALLALSGAFLLVWGYKSYSKEQAGVSSVYSELSEKLLVLEARKRESERAIADIKKSLEKAVEIHSTVSLVFRGMSEMIYTDIFPIMNEAGLKGTLAVSQHTFPGTEGCMTAEQADVLAAAGWKFIPEWSEGDGLNGISSVDLWLRETGYIIDCIVMISEQSYTTEIEHYIAISGYNTLIINTGSGGDSVVSTDTIGKMWKPGAMGYRGNNLNSVLAKAIDSRGHITFVIGFESTNEMYMETKFTAMLSYLQSYENDLEIMTVMDAKQYRMDYDARLKAYSDSKAAEIAYHESNIFTFEEQIKALYEEYGVKEGSGK